MSRPVRIDRAEDYHHVRARGRECQVIFRDESDQLRFLELHAQQSSRKQCGLKLAELGMPGGGIDCATVSNRVRRVEAIQSEDPELKSLMEQTLKYLETRSPRPGKPPASNSSYLLRPFTACQLSGIATRSGFWMTRAPLGSP